MELIYQPDVPEFLSVSILATTFRTWSSSLTSTWCRGLCASTPVRLYGILPRHWGKSYHNFVYI